jgi:hypothetical protein
VLPAPLQLIAVQPLQKVLLQYLPRFSRLLLVKILLAVWN